LDLLKTHSPAAAVLDINLADHRVTPVAQELATRDIPYVLASAYGDLDVENEPLFAKAVNLGKPTLPRLLLSEVGRMVGATGNKK
jgi:DNA-binding NtrC family response regulator